MNKKRTFQKEGNGSAARRIELVPAADLAAFMRGWQTVSAAFGYDGRVYILLVDAEPEREQGMFVRTELERRPIYKALIVDLPDDDAKSQAGRESEAADVEEIMIEGESFNYHFLQPLGGELLLVGARSRYAARDRYDLNAAVFDREGRAKRRFVIGDGIGHVQTTAGGLIWTGFFDEGVFGNYGWKRPIGESGLIAWDGNGICVFTNSEADIADCYALNAVSDEEVWFYYYTDFKLCRLAGPADRPEVSFFDPGVAGSSLLATDGELFLLDGGYGEHESYKLLRRSGGGGLEPEYDLMFADQAGLPLPPGLRDARGDKLLMLNGTELYLFSLKKIER
ncbi:hypothetical protein [Saccharibacillus alkalitolerans]|uniref:Uncharacterized protein n=1 Tax=Saccharibacillus alkalitolerans TaxID=2705290 RepID=A0ABX0F6W2_9BACL|nr:hypothetical protein [Saccharibacillus alkalitolerans]NGZ76703.1 hypothetical protein [Saccharibacillus alkalitolerans]